MQIKKMMLILVVKNENYEIMKIITLIGFIFGILSCSSESLKRTSYETWQNIGERQGEKGVSTECPERER